MSIDNSKPGDRSSRRLSLLPPIITSTDAIDDNNDGELETVDMNNSISNAQPNQLLNQRSFSSSSTSVDTNSRVPPSPPPRDMTSPPLPKRGNPHTDNPALPPRPSFGSKRRLFSHEEEKRNRSDEERGDDKEGYEKDNYDDDDDDDDDENDQKDDTFQDLASIRRRSTQSRFD
ncbi:hypothetical protein B5S33_g3904 [[Candida] boidinii]|nr:hypothetical protein B5S33_g3904 [[Candida] boidinii]